MALRSGGDGIPFCFYHVQINFVILMQYSYTLQARKRYSLRGTQASEMCWLFFPFSCASVNRLNVLFQTAKGPTESQDFEATNQRSFKCLLVLEWVSIYGDIFILINPSCLI